jgi:coiled-coil domain-containing protein 55
VYYRQFYYRVFVQKSQYVENLQQMAKVREIEHDRIFERKLLKERAAEDALFPDQPQFITAAYKEKLQNEKKWEAEDKLAEELEKRTDVRASGMHGFYANLLNKNVSMGGDVKNAISAYTAGSTRQSTLLVDDSEKKPSAAQQATSAPSSAQPMTTAHTDAVTTENVTGQKRARDEEGEAPVTAAVTASTQEPVSVPSTKPEKPVQDRESKILSARERYLARKSQV